MRVAVISPYLVPPASNGARARIDRLAAWLRRRGHDVHFVWAQTDTSTVPAAAAREALTRSWGRATVLPHSGRPSAPDGPDWGLDDWLDPTHEEPFRRAMRRFDPDIAVVNYVFLSRFLEWLPSRTVRYLDTHDRLSRREVYERHDLDAGFFFTTVEEELRGCARADVVFAIQDEEHAHFAASGRPVAIVGHPEQAAYLPPPPTGSRRLTVGFAAAYNKFNAVSLRALFDALERRDVLTEHGARLRIAGNLVGRALEARDVVRVPESVESLGFVPDLDAFYMDLDLVLNPTIVGTGLKIKTVEAISRAKPLLSTAVGSEGLAPVAEYHRCADVSVLVSSLADILAEPGCLDAMANTSRHLHAEYLLNLERNLANLFSPDVLPLRGSVDRAMRFVRGRTGPLASVDRQRSLSLGDPALVLRPALRLAHIVNPAPAGEASDLYSAQPITFESMRRAAAYAETQNVDVELRVVIGGKDELTVPPGFTEAPERAGIVTEVKSFAVPRPLPLLREILSAGSARLDADFLIFTNADIAVLPHFYTFVAEKIAEGHDALVVNRRTIDRDQLSVRHLESLYTKIGDRHPGYDCFIVRRELLDRFDLGDVAVGVHLVGRVLLWNLLAHARNPLLVDDAHVTFHLGDDNSGKRPDFLDYVEHNTESAIDVLDRLQRDCGLVDRLENELKDFAPGLLSVAFNPKMLVDRSGELDSRLAQVPIFVHALFRTGSTFLWSAIRRSPWHRAYYEPLHEALSYLRSDELDRLRAKYTTQARHDLEGDWLFAEYEDLLEPGRTGVPGYRREFAYETYADNSPQPSLRWYIDGLIDAAGPKQPVLQMNRSALRQRWFHREYPEAHHLYLVRDPRQQWASYLRFMAGEARGFARNDAVICGMNRYRRLIAPLNELVPLEHDRSQGDFFKRYDAVFDAYTWEQRYTLFYYLWLQALLEAAATGSRIVHVDRVSRELPARLHIETYLAVRGVRVDLGSLQMTTYDAPDLPLTTDRLTQVEESVRALLVSSFGGSRTRQLAAEGFGELLGDGPSPESPNVRTQRRDPFLSTGTAGSVSAATRR